MNKHDMTGIAMHDFGAPTTTLRRLKVSLIDSDGQPARVGRVHLWFKMCVNHG